jgi:hypothetical protein
MINQTSTQGNLDDESDSNIEMELIAKAEYVKAMKAVPEFK